MAFAIRAGKLCSTTLNTCFSTLSSKEPNKTLEAMNLVISYLNKKAMDIKSEKGASLIGKAHCAEANDLQFLAQRLEQEEWSLKLELQSRQEIRQRELGRDWINPVKGILRNIPK